MAELYVFTMDIEYGSMPHLNAERRDRRSVDGKYRKPRCIAFNTQNSRLNRLNPGTDKIIELARDGKPGARHEVLGPPSLPPALMPF